MALGFKIVEDKLRVYFEDNYTVTEIPEGGEAPPGSTVFTLRPIPFRLARKLGRAIMAPFQIEKDENGIPVLGENGKPKMLLSALTDEEFDNQNRMAQEALSYSIVDWKGLADPNGREIKFNPEKIQLLPQEIFFGLADFLWMRANPKLEAELKNEK